MSVSKEDVLKFAAAFKQVRENGESPVDTDTDEWYVAGMMAEIFESAFGVEVEFDDFLVEAGFSPGFEPAY